MPSISTPSSPLADLGSWESQKQARAEGVLLTADLAALAQAGSSVSLGTCDAGGKPIVAMGVGCIVKPDGTLRAILGRTANIRLLQAIESGQALAVTFVSATNHRAFQVKATHARACPSHHDDLPEMDRQCALFRDGLVQIGFSPELAAGFVRYDAAELVAIEFKPERVFTQTPGPGAGAELVP